MYWQYGMSTQEKQAGRQLLTTLTQQLLSFLETLVEGLDTRIDKVSPSAFLPQFVKNRLDGHRILAT